MVVQYPPLRFPVHSLQGLVAITPSFAQNTSPTAGLPPASENISDEVCKAMGAARRIFLCLPRPAARAAVNIPHRQLDLFEDLGKNSLGRISPWAVRSASQAASLTAVWRPATFLTWAALANTSANSPSERMCQTGFQ